MHDGFNDVWTDHDGRTDGRARRTDERTMTDGCTTDALTDGRTQDDDDGRAGGLTNGLKTNTQQSALG